MAQLRSKPVCPPLLLSLVAGLLVVAVSSSPPAAAQSAAGPHPVDMTQVSELPERHGWGVEDKDPLASHNFPNLVWDFAQVGNRMFVAGSFLNVRNPATGVKYSQPYLAAFDVDTGVWDPSFTPALDGPVYALEVNANGVLIAGGEFTNLNGTPFTEGIVGIDPATGAPAGGFQLSVERPWAPQRAIVRSLEIVGPQLYVGGNFSHIRGSGGNERYRVHRLARADALSGTPDPGWVPVVQGGGVWGFGIDTSRGRLHAGGIEITGVANLNTPRLITVDLDTGAPVPGQITYQFNTTSQRDIWDVGFAGDKIWVAGEQHVLGVMSPTDRARLGYHSTGLRGPAFPFPGTYSGGAFQVVKQLGDWVIAGCHCTYEWRSRNNYSGFTWHDSFADVRRPIKIAGAINPDTGVALDWSPDLAGSEEGAWAIGSDTNGCLWLGGDFRLGGLEAGSTFYLGGFARFCPPGAVGATTLACTATTMPNGHVLVAWNDIGVNGVDVSADGRPPVWQTRRSWVDTNPGTTYTVRSFGQNA